MKKKITGLLLGAVMLTLSSITIHAAEYDNIPSMGGSRSGTSNSSIGGSSSGTSNSSTPASGTVNNNYPMESNNNLGSNRNKSNMNENNHSGRLNLNNDTYIIQDGDDLWLVMGHIKAKLDILIYTDPSRNDNSNSQVSENEKNTLSIPIIQATR